MPSYRPASPARPSTSIATRARPEGRESVAGAGGGGTADGRIGELDADDGAGVEVVLPGPVAQRVELDLTLLVAGEAQAAAAEEGVEADLVVRVHVLGSGEARNPPRVKKSVLAPEAAVCRVRSANRVGRNPTSASDAQSPARGRSAAEVAGHPVTW